MPTAAVWAQIETVLQRGLGWRHEVDDTGTLPLPWLAEPRAGAGHTAATRCWCTARRAWVRWPAFTLAQACEAAARPCGRCGSCRLVQGHVHPDLTVLLPETLRREHDWPLPDDKPDSDEAKRKPSRQIRIDEVRLLIERLTRTSARGHGKVALLHPADVLNLQSANALLKTLEEPAAGTRLLLTTADPATLLPTVRSRCQLLRLAEPATGVALA
jgi:DNA polymerase-3 subunit delta'